VLQPTPDEHAADKKSLEGILAKHNITANENAVKDLMKWRFGN